MQILKQLQTQSPLTWCHISTFTLTIPVSPLTHNSLRCPFTTLNTQISLQLQFFSTHIHSAVYSSLFSNYLQIQKTVNGPIVNFELFSVLPCSSNNYIMLWGNNTRPVFKGLLVFFFIKQLEMSPPLCVWLITIYLWVTECVWTYVTTFR